MKSYMKKVLAGVLVLGMAGSVSADTTIYTNKALWAAAAGTYATEAFEDSTLNLGVSVISDVGDVSSGHWTDELDEAESTKKTTTWTFEGGIRAFGGYWRNIRQEAGIAVVIDGVVIGEEISRKIDGSFWGIVSDDPFTSVHLKAGTQGSTPAERYNLYNMVYSDPSIDVSVDIHPGTCPNSINSKSKGVTPMAILGTEGFEVIDINVSTLKANGYSPVRSALEDVATPYEGGFSNPAVKYDCNDYEGDGNMDLTLKFDTQDILEGLEKGEQYMEITGETNDGTPFTAKDVVRVK